MRVSATGVVVARADTALRAVLGAARGVKIGAVARTGCEERTDTCGLALRTETGAAVRAVVSGAARRGAASRATGAACDAPSIQNAAKMANNFLIP